MEVIKPFVKWAGGKGSLISQLTNFYPFELENGTIKKYVEPFVGGGAVLIDILQKYDVEEAYAFDINKDLINCYNVIKQDVETLIEKLNEKEKEFLNIGLENRQEYFYKIRSEYNSYKIEDNLDVKRASEFIFLNRTCFNGLYRVNSKGEFNVPFNGKLSGRSFDPDQLRELSGMLKNANILNTDFEVACENASEGDFVFFDPPYYNTFDTYQADGFSEEDHRRLAKLFKELTAKGVKCMLTNSNEEFIKDLYKDFNIKIIPVKRNINRDGTHRTGEEIIGTNYEKAVYFTWLLLYN